MDGMASLVTASSHLGRRLFLPDYEDERVSFDLAKLPHC